MLVKTLVELGVLSKKRRGPAIARTPSESLRVKREQMNAGDRRRRALINEAKRQGLPPPVFQPGRPCKYASDEERMAARREQYKIGALAYKERVAQGVEALRERTVPHADLSRWSV